jgi:mono/diheme cytochrome c family protein
MKRLAILLVSAASSAQAAHELESRDIENGTVLYTENCASCHGANLEGQPDWRVSDENGVLPAPPHDDTGHTWHHDNRLLFEYTKLGGQAALALRGVTGFKSGMPSFSETLSDDEIWEILAFIRSTWPERIQENHLMRNPPHD